MKVSTTALYGVGAAIVAAAVLYVLVRPRAAGAAAGKAVAGAAVGVVSGAAEGVGQAVGVPLTDPVKCQQCIAARDWWHASLYCPAGTFLKALFGGSSSSPPAPSSAPSSAPGAPATAAQPGAGSGPAPDLSGAGDLPFYGVGA